MLVSVLMVTTSIVAIIAQGYAGGGPLSSQTSTTLDGTSLRSHLKNITQITDGYPAFRVAGSSGAEAVADYIDSSFIEMGLESNKENFVFTNWDLDAGSNLTIDLDGDLSTLQDRSRFDSFVPESFSWPRWNGSDFSQFAILPMPLVSSYSHMSSAQSPTSQWDELNTTGKFVVVAREIRWRSDWEMNMVAKFTDQTPAGIIYVWWYDWMSFADDISFASSGGKPLGPNSGYLWDLGIASGSLNNSEGKMLIHVIQDGSPLGAMRIPSVIGTGSHTNVVAKIPGIDPSSKRLLITAHYDSVMCQGLVDNAGGVASMLQIAHEISVAIRAGTLHAQYQIEFVAFAAEEMGLVGSAHYVDAHRNSLDDIVAVINMDCIGSSQMRVSATPASGGIDMDRTFTAVAENVGVDLMVVDDSGSDQDTFRSPASISQSIMSYWGVDLDLDDIEPLDQATMVHSQPLFLVDGREDAPIGFIHTVKDGFWSDGGTWIDQQDLVEQASVALGAVLSLNSMEEANDTSVWTYLVVAAVLIMMVVATWFILKKRKMKG